MFQDPRRVTIVDLDAQVELNCHLHRALQMSINDQPMSNLKEGLGLTQACFAWRDLILND